MDGTDTDENGINDSEENLEIIPMIAAGKDKEIKETEVYGCRNERNSSQIGGPDSEP